MNMTLMVLKKGESVQYDRNFELDGNKTFIFLEKK